MKSLKLLPFKKYTTTTLSPLFEPGERTPKNTEEELCEASRRLAVLYAQHGEDGFEEIASHMDFDNRDNYFGMSRIEVDDDDKVAWETMFRLFLTACPSLVPSEALTAASYCGGISPGDAQYIAPLAGCPGAGDPGKHAYGSLCGDLQKIFEQMLAKDPDLESKVPAVLRPGKNRLFTIKRDDRLAVFVKASLGASDAAYAVSQYTKEEVSDWMRSYSEIVGASYGNGDRVTPFIDGWIRDFIERGGCGCENCVWKYGDRGLERPATPSRVTQEDRMEAEPEAATAPVALPANATCASAPNASAPRCSEQSERNSWTAGADTQGLAGEDDSDLSMLSSVSSATERSTRPETKRVWRPLSYWGKGGKGGKRKAPGD